MEIKEITFEQIHDNLQQIMEYIIKKLKTDKIYDTNKGYYVLENSQLNRVYIEAYNHEKYEGVSINELHTLIKYFNIKEPYIFSYPYSHEESLICIGKVQENEVIY